MSGERHVRRWVLLAFGASVGGGCARTAVEFARALDCFHAGRDAEARALFASVAAARPADPEPADYLERLAARGRTPERAAPAGGTARRPQRTGARSQARRERS